MLPLPPPCRRGNEVFQGGVPKSIEKSIQKPMPKTTQKNTPFEPKGPTFVFQVSFRVPNGDQNRSVFGFGGKRCFCNLSHTESSISGLQGTPKVKKIRVKIGFPNDALSKRCFCSVLGRLGCEKIRKGSPKGPQGTPEGTLKRKKSPSEASWDPGSPRELPGFVLERF